MIYNITKLFTYLCKKPKPKPKPKPKYAKNFAFKCNFCGYY